MNPNIVKVVTAFPRPTRSNSSPALPSPGCATPPPPVAARHFKHIGLYVFRRDALLEFPALPPGELERLEQLEQLRWMENGFHMHVVETMYNAVSVDVPADIDRVEKLLHARAKTSTQSSN